MPAQAGIQYSPALERDDEHLRLLDHPPARVMTAVGRRAGQGNEHLGLLDHPPARVMTAVGRRAGQGNEHLR
jgi:hypothetical protein